MRRGEQPLEGISVALRLTRFGRSLAILLELAGTTGNNGWISRRNNEEKK
jgi:hypothetical protein